ncbi:N-succinyl-L-ornithine transcarbamylase [Catalinimonas alkaloidigena]|uniref:N-succinylornithine carbamoyltransferase n=1 Tax=Catalinimonas alkaloidigena TaxID=1075417 RepID=A0A1G9T5D0_9BACT|nr:N-acetylornithine carbamoyltransferase [Catalinimonas alkaloidigena]SDM42836.1 N-succinyl-L-ornithine transcarbamylase [Catalinimonas alkaloidigena]
MQHFLSVHDTDNLSSLVAEARQLKSAGVPKIGQDKTLGLIFFNPSLRTRLSTQVAAQKLGMSVVVMNVDKDGWKLETAEGVVMDGDTAEHIKDAAAVMGQYCDVLGVRAFPTLKNRAEDYSDRILHSFVRYAGRPIVSLESAIRHPLQSLADLITIEEHKTVARPKVVLTWAPHPRALPQAVPNSFVEWMKEADVDLVVTHPQGYELSEDFTKGVTIEHDQNRAFAGADFIYAKNWSSYQDYGQILSRDPSWTVTAEKMALTNQAKFMHCLPVRRNVIVTDAVLDSPQSLILPEAENRTWSATVVLKRLLESL